MKIALCLSGQPRFWKRGFHEQIFPNLINNYDVDVFVHTWNIPQDQFGKPYINAGGHAMGTEADWPQVGDLNRLVDLYKPKSFLFEDQIDFPIGKYANRAMPSIRSDYTYSSFYSQKKASQLKKAYEEENGFVYDIVVRTRFDIMLSEKFEYSCLDLNAITTSLPWSHVDGYNDNFVAGSSDAMDTYCALYDYIDDIMDNTSTRFCGEMLVKTYIDSYMKMPVNHGPFQNLYR